MPSAKFVKICTGLLGLYLVGLALTVTGYATDFWLDTAGGSVGLFKTCVDGVGCSSIDFSLLSDEALASFSMLTIGMSVGVIAGCIYMFVPISAGLQIFSGVCTIIGVSIYAGYPADTNPFWDPEILGFSFILSVCGAACLIANGIVLLVLLADDDGMRISMTMPGRSGKVDSS